MRFETVKTDVTVIGGGLAGVCAAIAAAREGSTVALVQNRPVLGGNSSSEVRVWVCGATAAGKHRYARETGIMGELYLENQFRNPDGNPYYWDLVMLDAIKAEANIQLFLNTDVHELEADGPQQKRIIRSVTGWMQGSERKIRFESAIYMDCTGDGLIGFLAGAEFRIGREARDVYNEEWAPEIADEITLGSTMLFYSKDAGQPVKFVPPSFAKDIMQTPIPEHRIIKAGDSGCHYWWIEWGGEQDTVHNNEEIRDELWAVIYGIWDYIKNSGKFDADHMTLEWVGSIPGKREYRRLIGDYVLTQNDIMAQQPFEDRVAFGGWSIDLHPPQGMYATDSGSKHMFSNGIYHIPFRSLYSVNVANMLMAGRNISASHVAFGTTRVMATCAVMGEAAGTAAALCVQMGVEPRRLYEEHIQQLQQTLLRRDASIIGLTNMDSQDLAKQAKVTASSELQYIAVEEADERLPLDSDKAILFPVHPEMSGLELLVSSEEETVLHIELWSTDRGENYVPVHSLAKTEIQLRKGQCYWAPVSLSWQPEQPCNAFVIIRQQPGVSLHWSNKPLTGVLSFERSELPAVDMMLENVTSSQLVTQWRMKRGDRKVICFRVNNYTEAYAAQNAIDGFLRPFAGPHMWVSEPMKDNESEWIQLSWQKPIDIQEMQLVWNDDVNEYFNNLHFYRTPFEIMPELVKDYDIEVLQEGSWQKVIHKKENRQRKNSHFVKESNVTALRVKINQTNGSERAELIELRVY